MTRCSTALDASSRSKGWIVGIEREPRAGQKGGLWLSLLYFGGASFCLAATPNRGLPGRSASPMSIGAQVQLPVTQRSEPIFNVPAVVLATVAVLVAVHVLRVLVLTQGEDIEFLLAFAFIPARYSAQQLAGGPFPGGFGAELWTFFTYAFIHADFMHIGLNLAWLLPFGTALARRFGPWRYVGFMLVMAAAGAFAHLISHLGAMVPMIGASAAISGAMAAALRFVFQEGGPLEFWRGEADGLTYQVPAASLAATLRDPRFLIFLAAWVGLNLLIGLGNVSLVGKGEEVAWQAHIGGFVAGLLLFTAFDPVSSRRRLDTEPSR